MKTKKQLDLKKLDYKGWVETVSPDFVRKLREATQPEGQASLWLNKMLNDGQLIELYFRIFKHNEDLRDIAFMVKKDWDIKTKWQVRDFIPGLKKWRDALSNTFSEYKDLTDTKDAIEKIERRQEVQKKLSKELNILDKLAYAVELNYKRLQMIHDRELQAKIPLRMADDITKTFAYICSAYTEAAVKTGVIEQQPSEININLKRQSDIVLRDYIGEDGNKMVKAAHTFLENISKKCITMNLNKDTGEYELAGKSTTLEEKIENA